MEQVFCEVQMTDFCEKHLLPTFPEPLGWVGGGGFKVIQLVIWVLGVSPCPAIKINSRWIKRIKGKKNQSMGNKK